MSTAPPPFYQGRDWVSERWTAAEMCDALDKIHDLCLFHAKQNPASLFQSELSLIPLLIELLDTVHKNLLHLACEIIPPSQNRLPFAEGWQSFESRLLYEDMDQKLIDLTEGQESRTLRQIAGRSVSLKQKICTMDQ